MMSHFNYIVTVHNKEFLLEKVLLGIDKSASSTSTIIIVLDGCTDASEVIAKDFQSKSSKHIKILFAPDLHEIKSINIGLKEAKNGYCVIIQDDVILDEPNLESKILTLCDKYKNTLGYISFRMAANVKVNSLFNRLKIIYYFGRLGLKKGVKLYDFIASEHEYLSFPKAKYGEFVKRMVGIKSPVCLTPQLREHIPFIDESLAPYNYDDVDMSLMALKLGLINGLFPIKFITQEEWGGTRKDKNFNSGYGNYIRSRNERIVYQKHSSLIENYGNGKLKQNMKFP